MQKARKRVEHLIKYPRSFKESYILYMQRQKPTENAFLELMLQKTCSLALLLLVEKK